MVRFAGVGGALILATALARAATQPAAPPPAYEENLPLGHPAIRYGATLPADAVSALAARLRSGALALEVDRTSGVLPSLLKQLDVSVDSRVLVFSKTSFQHPLISPRRPRAIYFNDEAAVAVVPGASAFELAAFDPGQGARFYTLQGRTSPRPTITRRDVCLECHHGVATLGVPGMFVSSVFTSASGTAEREGAIVTDHRTPFEERWGGWYVTGTTGTMHHRGNAVAPNPAEPTVLDTEGARNLTSLLARFAPGMHLRQTSDVVALMTLEHQTFMLNLLTRLGWEARIADHENTPAARRQVEARVDEVVRHLLFEGEAPLPAPVAGASSFASTFAARGPFDRRGRTLRAFELHERLFRYPLSYTIYSRTFDALPAGVKDRIYRGLFDTLTRPAATGAAARLSADVRAAIVEILRDTKAGLPADWSRPAGPPVAGASRR